MSTLYPIFLKGDSIFLRPLMNSDLDGNYMKWLNDSEITEHNSHGRFPYNREKLEEYVKSAANSNKIILLAIVDIKSETHIGNISLQCINWIDRNAEIAFLLGERNFMSKGVMYEAGTMILSHAFQSLNLHRIYCGTSSNNIAMQKLAVKLGMTKEGERNDAIYNNGKYYSIFEYGIINTK